MKKLGYRRLVAWLGSRTAFRVIIGLFLLQAAWIALSGRYPMAFDEDFHLGIIKLYAHHLSPFWSTQPAGAAKFGAVARDPSYLYQYLMSFPYRLISVFTHDQIIQVIILRSINIGLFAWGIALFRRLLLKARASATTTHAILLVLVLIPVVPLLAAQINYDNLILPLTALNLLWTLEFNDELTARKRVDLRKLGELFILGLLTSLVKYAFLPIFAAMAIFILVRLWQKRASLRPYRRHLLAAWQRVSSRSRWGLLVGLVVALGLFGQRYGVNLVRYHAPVPDCSQVLNVEECSDYGPWIRDYDLALANVQPPRGHQQLTFTHAWLYGLWLRTFFAVDGPGTQYETRGPLLLPGLAAIVFAVLAGLALLSQLPTVFKQRNRSEFWLFGLVSLFYLGALWEDEYKAFVHTGQPVAINGRYLLPVLPLIILLVVVALNRLLRRWQSFKFALFSVLLICLLWGGGALTYILRSNDAWYWPNSAVRHINWDVQRTLGPVTPGYRSPTQFLH
jgi:hypothetical protein